MTTIKVPERYRTIQNKSKRYVGLMGLSVGKPNFENPHIMASYCDFMQNNFLYGLFVIADFPKKYNIMAIDGDSEKKAEERARIAGDNMRNALERITRDYPLVKVSMWRNHMDDKYIRNIKVLQEGYAADNGFRFSANELVNKFLSLPSNRVKWKTSEPPTDIAKNYLLDELAGLLSIPCSIQLPVCEIYPGRNEVHERVQNREFPFCRDLQIKDDRVFMEAYYEPSD